MSLADRIPVDAPAVRPAVACSECRRSTPAPVVSTYTEVRPSGPGNWRHVCALCVTDAPAHTFAEDDIPVRQHPAMDNRPETSSTGVCTVCADEWDVRPDGSLAAHRRIVWVRTGLLRVRALELCPGSGTAPKKGNTR
ncbi:hypothetical protein [Streptomyces huiliensis]|uniref:hypothetical protein n=1 Tax=Streptomyces huiliensis TaxID=2876027 RepID=UPI001CBBA932|nr:hypothetical protein [Streptomyces huiliensis]MBZ4319565.1 hypothetical protein [Streptomyces huiliensis]